jgi:predicted PurR-regulated permease PerM
MQRQVGVSAVVVIVALLAGGSLLGIIGAVLAVPTAAIAQVVIGQWLDERERDTEAATPS